MQQDGQSAPRPTGRQDAERHSGTLHKQHIELAENQQEYRADEMAICEKGLLGLT